MPYPPGHGSCGAGFWYPCRPSVVPLQPSRPLPSPRASPTDIGLGVWSSMIWIRAAMTIYIGRNGLCNSLAPTCTSPISPTACPSCPPMHTAMYVEYIGVLPRSCPPDRTGARRICKPSWKCLGSPNNPRGWPPPPHSLWASPGGVTWGSSPVHEPIHHHTARYALGPIPPRYLLSRYLMSVSQWG